MPPYSYTWDGNTGSQTSETAASLCPGIYSVTVTDSIGNQTFVFANVAEPVGIHETTERNQKLEIYPNPANNEVLLTWELQNQDENAIIRIIDIRGKVIFEEKIRNKGNRKMNVSTLSTGLYTTMVITSENVYTQRMVIK